MYIVYYQAIKCVKSRLRENKRISAEVLAFFESVNSQELKDFFLWSITYLFAWLSPKVPQTSNPNKIIIIFVLKTEKFNWFITYLVVENREGTYVKLCII